MWREAAFIEQLAGVPVSLEGLRSRPNRAFVYTVRLEDMDHEQLARSVAEIERVEGLVTCRVEGKELECVFLRPAESDVAKALRTLGSLGHIARARAVTYNWLPEEPAIIAPPKDAG
jgi:hypothetical protein